MIGAAVNAAVGVIGVLTRWDTLAALRKVLWAKRITVMSSPSPDDTKIRLLAGSGGFGR